MAKNTNWRVTARAGLPSLDDGQLEELFVDAFVEGDAGARLAFADIVQSHPEKIDGGSFFDLVSHAVMNETPELRDFARQQVVDLLKARGRAEPQLVKLALDARIVAAENKNPAFREAAQVLVGEVEALRLVSGPPTHPTLGHRARSILHLGR